MVVLSTFCIPCEKADTNVKTREWMQVAEVIYFCGIEGEILWECVWLSQIVQLKGKNM